MAVNHEMDVVVQVVDVLMVHDHHLVVVVDHHEISVVGMAVIEAMAVDTVEWAAMVHLAAVVDVSIMVTNDAHSNLVAEAVVADFLLAVVHVMAEMIAHMVVVVDEDQDHQTVEGIYNCKQFLN